MRKIMSSGAHVISNGHLYPVLGYWDMPKKEHAFYDYDTDQTGKYFKYCGQWYDLGKFTRTIDDYPEMAGDGWDGVAFDGYSCGTLIKVNQGDYYDDLIIGRFY